MRARPRVGLLARQPRRGHVHLADDGLEAVVGLGDGGAVERVRLDDVGAGREVLAVDLADDVGPRQHQEVVVPLEVARVVREARPAEVRLLQAAALHHGAHRAVEHEDAAGEQGRQHRGG